MRRPWEITAGVPDDVESLQTDIMRFVAILGLCLTAIFSLVNAAREEGISQAMVVANERESQQPEENVPAVATVSPDQQTLPPAPVQAPNAKPAPPATVTPDIAAPRAGEFSLEFASAGALAALRERGDVAVYAIVEDGYWLLDTGGTARRVAPPASYYRMHEDTLPDTVLRAAHSLAAGANITWAVTLPASVASEIEQLLSRTEGGALVIGAAGSVALER